MALTDFSFLSDPARNPTSMQNMALLQQQLANMQQMQQSQQQFPLKQQFLQAQTQQQQAQADKIKAMLDLVHQSFGAGSPISLSSSDGQQAQQVKAGPDSTIPGTNVSGKALALKWLTGVDTITPTLQAKKEEDVKQFANQQKNLAEQNQAAQQSAQISNLLDRFNNAYKQSTYKGPSLGKIGGNPFLSNILHNLGVNMAPEQSMTALSHQIQRNVAGQFANQIGKSHFGTYDVKMAGRGVPSPTSTQAEVDTYIDWVKGLQKRVQEKAQFFNALRNSNLTEGQKEAAWGDYVMNNPIANKDQTGVNAYNQKWRDYLPGGRGSQPAAKQNVSPRDESGNNTIVVEGPKGRFKTSSKNLKMFLDNGYKRVQ